MKNRPTPRPALVAIPAGATHVKTADNSEKTIEQFYDEISGDVLARTLWGEARGEGCAGMQAVANVVMNRVRIAEKSESFWWGNNVIQVCQKPYQFSCWNRSDPNFKKLQEVDSKNLYFATAQRIAQRALAGVLEDITHGATHYHTRGCEPYWAHDKKNCAEIGHHVFYDLTDTN